jgi:5'-phosphate synthase pdxT subunit
VRVGVLALQGDYAAHSRAVAARGGNVIEVRTPADMSGLDGLVLPGGESTTMLKLMDGNRLADCIVDAIRHGTPTLATCAGVILLAREVRAPAQRSLGLLDITVERNGYGRQLDSAVIRLQTNGRFGGANLEGVFIRAPRILVVGPSVEVLARRKGDPVLVLQGKVLAATFHPELGEPSPVIDLFAAMVGAAARERSGLTRLPEPAGEPTRNRPT